MKLVNWNFINNLLTNNLNFGFKIMIIYNKLQMELPAVPRSSYGEENTRKQFSKTIYEKNCEILTVNNKIFEENTGRRSEDSSDSISTKQGDIVGLFSVLNNDVPKPPEISTSDKSINVQLSTYSDSKFHLKCSSERYFFIFIRFGLADIRFTVCLSM